MKPMHPDRLRRVRVLRRDLSPPELKLWLELKSASAGRCPFRKQHPVGLYVLDFYCAPLKLCVEIDGFAHGTQDRGKRDERRDAWLAARGVEVIRYTGEEVMRNASVVADGLLRLVAERLGSPPPTVAALRPPPPRAGEV